MRWTNTHDIVFNDGKRVPVMQMTTHLQGIESFTTQNSEMYYLDHNSGILTLDYEIDFDYLEYEIMPS